MKASINESATELNLLGLPREIRSMILSRLMDDATKDTPGTNVFAHQLTQTLQNLDLLNIGLVCHQLKDEFEDLFYAKFQVYDMSLPQEMEPKTVEVAHRIQRLSYPHNLEITRKGASDPWEGMHGGGMARLRPQLPKLKYIAVSFIIRVPYRLDDKGDDTLAEMIGKLMEPFHVVPHWCCGVTADFCSAEDIHEDIDNQIESSLPSDVLLKVYPCQEDDPKRIWTIDRPQPGSPYG